MDLLESVVQCPSCGESIVLLIDPSALHQRYIEDCSVCCRPMQVTARVEEGVASVEVEPS